MSNEYDMMLEEIIDEHEEYLASWVLYHPDEYEHYVHGGIMMVPYGSTMVSLPEEIEIREEVYKEALMLAAQHAWEDERIIKQNNQFILKN